MFDYSLELLNAREIEKLLFSNLESSWKSLEDDQREQITESVEQLKSHGAICSEYDFI